MSISHDQEAVLYVVSRSGKVLESEERSREFTLDADGDYFEGELEGWIFWGSNREACEGKGSYDNRASSSSYDSRSSTGQKRLGNGFTGASGRSSSTGFMENSTFGNFGRVSWTTRIPVAVLRDETDSIKDFFSPMDWTKSLGGSSTVGNLNCNETTARRRDAASWEDDAVNLMFEQPLARVWKPHDFFRSESWYRMEQCYKIGLAQVAILQKSDVTRRWEPGTRELAARWAAWLLKMLRKTRSRPLQHLLFTMFSSLLPVICCSLVGHQWTRVPDPELCRCVEIVQKALEKSHECFTPVQWEILEERLMECRKVQMRLGTFVGRGVVPMGRLKDSLCGKQLNNGASKLSCTAPQDAHHQQSSNSRDQQLSNVLLQSEGVAALVKRAVRDKLSTHQLRRMDLKGLPGSSGGSGSIVSLVCPISGKRIKVPARGRDCNHLASFDLQSFLEEHAKRDRQRSNSVRQQKRPKMETGTWCCPICGADAMWPQLVVDGLLLRILEVLPEHMPEVCLLPNGRWRVVWNPVGLDLGENERQLTTVAVRLPFNSTLEDDMYSHPLGYQQSYGCSEVQMLHRAYKAWKDGVDHHLSRGGNAEQSKLQRGAKSAISVWTDDHNSSRDALWQASPQKLINIGEPGSRVREEITESVNCGKADSGNGVSDNVARISEAEASDSPKADVETEIASASKLILDALQASEEIGTRLRIGQPKSRPKLMARKS